MVGLLAWWGIFLAVLLLAWLITPGEPWPSAFTNSVGWFTGARGAWLLLGPWWALWAVALAVRRGADKALPVLALGVAATPALLAWWPASAMVLSQVANVVWMLLLFLALIPVAFVMSLFG